MAKRNDKDIRKSKDESRVRPIALEEQNEDLRQARAEVEEGLRKYYDLYNFAPIGYFNLSDEGMIQEVNFTGASLLGYERPQLINRRFSDFLSEKSRLAFTDFLREIYKDPIKKTCELMLCGENNNRRYVHIEGFAAEADADMGRQCLMAVLDITERCRIEAELRKSEERYRTIFENANEGIFQTTPEGRFISANPSAARMFGYASPEELQVAMDDIGQLLYKHPADRARMMRILAEEDHVVNYEVEMYREDGQLIWISINARSVRGHDDRLLFYEGTFQDITERRHAEEKLRTTSDFLENLLNYANAPIIVWDSEYTITLFNHAFERLTGREAEEVIGKDISLLFPEEERGKSMAYIRQASAGERWETVEISIQDVRGGIHILLWNSANLKDADGRQRVATIAQGQDITDRKHAEEKLCRTRDFLENLLNYANAPVIVWDSEYTITLFNHAFERLTGREAEEVIGKDISLLFPEDERDKSMAYIRQASAGERWETVEISIQDVRGGTHILLWNSANLQKADGHRRVATIAQGQDITDRKHAEEKLRRTRDFLENLLNYANAPIIVWDSEYTITLFNHAFERLTGREAEEVIGKDISLLFPEDERDKSMAYIRQASAGERWETVEISIQDVRGGIHILLWNSANLQEAYGSRRVATIAQGQDITERIKAEEERRKIELGILQTQKLESIGVLAGGIAHDFNNMLMVVLGNIDLALTSISEESPINKRLTDIRAVSIRAADLCRQLLAYAGKGRYVVETVNLSSMVEEMTSMFDVSISKKVFLQYNLAKWLPPIEADSSQISQVIMNLVINASEAIGDRSGAIYLSTSVVEGDQEYLTEACLHNDLKPGYYVCLEIADTGSGMDKDTIDKIFDPFFTTKCTGRGLGLAAVLGIVRGHKGGIKVYSEPGKGTTFKLLFPVAAELEESTAMVQNKEFDTWKGSGTVLLVDDDESVRSLSRLLLEHIGFNVLLAEDGRKALKIFSDHKQEIRCVILDLTMPHMGGEETFRELRLIDPHARIIMSSGYNEQDVVHRFLGKGISGFIQKPYQLKKLTHTLMKILEEKDDRTGDN